MHEFRMTVSLSINMDILVDILDRPQLWTGYIQDSIYRRL